MRSRCIFATVFTFLALQCWLGYPRLCYPRLIYNGSTWGIAFFCFLQHLPLHWWISQPSKIYLDSFVYGTLSHLLSSWATLQYGSPRLYDLLEVFIPMEKPFADTQSFNTDFYSIWTSLLCGRAGHIQSTVTVILVRKIVAILQSKADAAGQLPSKHACMFSLLALCQCNM